MCASDRNKQKGNYLKSIYKVFFVQYNMNRYGPECKNIFEAQWDDGVLDLGKFAEIILADLYSGIVIGGNQKGFDIILEDKSVIEAKFVTPSVKNCKNAKMKKDADGNCFQAPSLTVNNLHTKDCDLSIMFPWLDGTVRVALIPMNVWKPMVKSNCIFTSVSEGSENMRTLLEYSQVIFTME